MLRPKTYLFATALALLPAAGAAGSSFFDPLTGGDIALAEPAAASSSGDYLAGVVASARQDLGVAADFLLSVQAERPDDVELTTLAFLLAAAAGRSEAADRLAELVLAQQPGHGAANLVLAVKAAVAEDWVKTRAHIAGLPGEGVAGAVKPLLAAWSTFPSKGLQAALDGLEPLARQQGLAVLYHLHRALLSDLGGDAEGARQAYEEALAGANQRSARLVLLAGNFYARTGDKAAAEKLYGDYLAASSGGGVVEAARAALSADDTPAPLVSDARDGLAETLYQVAGVLAEEGATDVALIQVHLALRLEPTLYAAHLLLGEILQEQKRYAEAVTVLENVPPEASQHWLAGLTIAEALYVQKKVEPAIAKLEALAKERPEDLEALFRLGNLLRAEQRFAEAAGAYDRAVERLPEITQRVWSLFYFRGIVLERTGQWERAEADFLKALELEPEQPQVMNYLAYSWVEKKKNLDQAKAMLVRAVELRPRDGYIVDSLGWVLYRLGDYKGAVTHLERAVELSPAQSVINDHLGDAYWRVGRKREARVQWQRALSLPDDPELDAETVRNKVEKGLPDGATQ